ncbi:MAG: hypothetical protein R3248_08900 [Candidatus Promineifilaceae bacterium]|nr:hypothetical protein [Candidatus Promineifilaceae bacterium]
MMKLWLKRPIVLILLAAGVALGGALLGNAVLAQAGADQAAPGERAEGSDGRSGRILDLTPEQIERIQQNHLSVVYHFAGALNATETATEKATVVQCTNIHASETTEVEVQLFQYDASAVYTGTISVDPMKTATFESSPVPFYVADVFLGAGNVEQGYGRIMSTHEDIVCTVQTIDPVNSPPTWSFDLPLYHRTAGGALLPAILREQSR